MSNLAQRRSSLVVSRLVRLALETLLPSRCVGCGAGGDYFCRRCAADARRSAWGSLPEASPLSDALAPYAYEGTPRAAVHSLKYRSLRAVAPAMAETMARELALTIPPPFTLVPVPLHPGRLRERGYNQAELLARAIAAKLECPLRADLLRRTRAAPPQVSASNRFERARNVSGAFAAAPISGGVFILVDDVRTTGATLESAANALLKAGASRVYGLTFAYDARNS